MLFVFLELAAIVGLPDQAAEIDAIQSQVYWKRGSLRRIIWGQ